MIKNKKMLAAKGILTALLTTIPMLAFAASTDKTVGDVANVINQQFPGMYNILDAASYILGTISGIHGTKEFISHNNDPDRTTLSRPLVLLFIAAVLYSMPSLMETSVASVFGNDASVGQIIDHG